MRVLYIFLSIWVLTMSVSMASGSYTDYLPRYRKLGTEAYLINKIEYQNRKVVIHFRFVADKEPITFLGKDMGDAWVVSSPQRGGTTGEERVHRAEVFNIRINDRMEVEHLAADSEFSFSPTRGDIISCEIHFEAMPAYVRTVNLFGGERNRLSEPRFNCAEIQIKGAYSNALGSADQMNTVIDRFYQEAKFVRYPDIREITSLDNERRFREIRQQTKAKAVSSSALAVAMEPIDYMPKMLVDFSDLQCEERLILQNVQFEDNKAEFSRRATANRTFAMIYDFMRDNPESRIVLHGHTDIFGDPQRNLVLSKHRVQAIKRAIASKGAHPDRIITLYYGGSQPLPLYKTGGAMNRRVELEVICGKPQIAPSGGCPQ